MNLRSKQVMALTGVASALAVTTAFAATPGITTGPSTPTNPYVLPVADGVRVKSLLTVDDAGSATNGYEMVGIPDGLGAFSQAADPTYTLFMNHELRDTQGVVRRHGRKGAFVSKLKIDKLTGEVVEGSDLINPGVSFWDYPSQTYRSDVPSSGGINPRDVSDTFLAQSAAFSRFCSGSLSKPGELLNETSGNGYEGQIYFANEESGDEGRAFGVTTNGDAQQLPRLGLFSWEQTIAAPNQSDRTLVLGNEDTGAGQVWAYSGTKQSTGNAFDKAGLTNGANFVVDLADEAVSTDAQFRAKYPKGTPARFDLGSSEEVDWDSSGARQNADALAKGLTLNRIEDGAIDPRHPNDYYFVTTQGGGTVQSEAGVSRDGGGLWRLRFDDIEQPSLGGTLELLLDGSEAPFLNKPDNIDIDYRGNLLIQEDPGNNAHVARIVAYEIDSGDRGVVAQFDPNQFRVGSPGFITQDEESSGIIDAKTILGTGWFVLDAQVHKTSLNAASVELGQLLALKITDFKKVYTIDSGL